MNIRQLESFLTVVELQSFSKAAKKLYMSQPAISLQIKALEEQLGVDLLERLERGVIPTLAGKVVCREAGEILAAFRRLEEEIGQIKGQQKGTVVVAASTVPGEYLLPGLIGEFRKLFPGITVTLVIGDTAQVANQLLSRQADVGITGADISQEELDCWEFFRDELVLLVPPGQVGADRCLTVGDLAGLQFILREPGSGTRQVFEDYLSNSGFDPGQLQVIMELGSTRAIITAVEAGLGAGVVSRLAAREALALGLVQELKLEGLPRERGLFVAARNKGRPAPATDAFLRFLKHWSDSRGKTADV